MTSPKGALWAENCPNFLAGKTEVFSGKNAVHDKPDGDCFTLSHIVTFDLNKLKQMHSHKSNNI
jgi:hypothetical protein